MGFSSAMPSSLKISISSLVIDSLGFKRKQITEPLTNYFVARAQQDINKGNTVVGGMFTATNRKIEDPRLYQLRSEAYSGGIDFLHHWSSRKYYVSGKGMISHVKGSEEAIAETQLSSERYFQRPDNDVSGGVNKDNNDDISDSAINDNNEGIFCIFMI